MPRAVQLCFKCFKSLVALSISMLYVQCHWAYQIYSISIFGHINNIFMPRACTVFLSADMQKAYERFGLFGFFCCVLFLRYIAVSSLLRMSAISVSNRFLLCGRLWNQISHNIFSEFLEIFGCNCRNCLLIKSLWHFTEFSLIWY